jgi:thiol-disulfide isomerase/thioredoxin
VVPLAIAAPVAGAEADSVPEHQVAAMYFHRTVRCPTCKKISAYIEEAVKANFGEQLKEKSVVIYMIDFQDTKNARYTKGYKITGPTFVLADVRKGKVTAWKPMPKVWTLVGKKDAFFKYVADGVRGYLEGE